VPPRWKWSIPTDAKRIQKTLPSNSTLILRTARPREGRPTGRSIGRHGRRSPLIPECNHSVTLWRPGCRRTVARERGRGEVTFHSCRSPRSRLRCMAPSRQSGGKERGPTRAACWAGPPLPWGGVGSPGISEGLSTGCDTWLYRIPDQIHWKVKFQSVCSEAAAVGISTELSLQAALMIGGDPRRSGQGENGLLYPSPKRSVSKPRWPPWAPWVRIPLPPLVDNQQRSY